MEESQGEQLPKGRRSSIISKSTSVSDSGNKPQATRRKSIFKQTPSISRKMTSYSIIPKSENENQAIFTPMQLEPTYQLAPEPGKEFSAFKVRKAIAEVLEDRLKNETYDPETCKELTVDLSTTIKNRIRDFQYPRYKLIVNVTVGQSQDQGFHAVSRCVWDEKTDTWACESYKNSSLFAVALVHAVYLE